MGCYPFLPIHPSTLLYFLLAFAPLTAQGDRKLPDKALCAVCALKGETAEESLEKIEKVRRKRSISYPLLWDAKNTPAGNAFKVKAIPAMFLIDPQGQIVAQWTGKFDHREVLAKVKQRLVEEN